MVSAFVEQFSVPQRTGNFVLDLHPLVKLNVMISLCALNFLFDSLYGSLGLCVFSFLIAAAAGKFHSFFKIYSKVILFFGLFWFIFNAAFSGGENVIFQLAGIRISNESLLKGLSSSLLVLGFSGIFLLFFQLTPMSKLMLAFENLGMSRTASFIFLSTFQSIIDLSVNARIILESQKSRGIETEGSLPVRLRAYIPVLGPLVLSAVASTEEKTIAMEARAFSASGKPTQLCQLPGFDAVQIGMVVLANLALILGIVFRVRGV